MSNCVVTPQFLCRREKRVRLHRRERERERETERESSHLVYQCISTGLLTAT